MNEKEIVILCGPPGSGKSTYAKELEARTYKRINQDDQGKDGHMNEFTNALFANRNIVVDRMNFNKQQRNRYLDPAKKLGYKTRVVVFHVPKDICMMRCLERKDHPTVKTQADASKALHFFFKSYERVEDSEVDVVERLGWEVQDKPKAIWVDVDNTLSNADHREHFLQGEKKNWKAFFDAMGEDPVNQWCKELIEGMYRIGYTILICSARPDDYRKQTESWLVYNGIPFDELIMRQRGDFRKDSFVKEIMYEFEIKPTYNLVFSVDDRKQVIEQIRSHGVTVLDCAGDKGNF
jgi:adenylate kinase family enzyme